jgi:hypothetical protein
MRANLRFLVPCVIFVYAGSAAAQGSGAGPIERLGNNLFRVGQIRVDTANHEIAVNGTVNPDVLTLEFIANSREGMKAYETAVSLDTDAVTFNTALVLIGLDKSHARGVPEAHFDRTVTEGDPVEIWVECPGGECQRMPAERLMFDQKAQKPLSGGTWVYTGSTFAPDGRYLAQLYGVLIGFVHDPASIIEYSQGAGLGAYGSIVRNPNLGLAGGTSIKVTVKALNQPTGR